MKRRLFAAVLSTFALLLLMGASDALPHGAALLAEEESAVHVSAVLETEAQSFSTQFSQVVLAAISENPVTVESAAGASQDPSQIGNYAWSDDNLIQPDSVPAESAYSQSAEQSYKGSNGTVSLSGYAQMMDPNASVSGGGKSVTITAGGVTLNATKGKVYVEVNGRYLYVPGGVKASDGQLYVPESVAAKAFSGLQSGDSFYNQNDLFWLSRVIHQESGNQSMEGKMAVGNVILNRMADPGFPNTIEGVLSQKNQFSTYKSGALRNTKPSASSVIAAKLVLEGAVVEATRGATFFDSSSNSWASRNKQYIATIGGHNFYG